jgi:hypothetical protein
MCARIDDGGAPAVANPGVVDHILRESAIFLPV